MGSQRPTPPGICLRIKLIFFFLVYPTIHNEKIQNINKKYTITGGIENFEPKTYNYRREMDNFVELKSNSDYFQKYLYQSYECEKFSSKSWKKWSIWREGVFVENFSVTNFWRGGIRRGGVFTVNTADFHLKIEF